jgi:acetolactate synthase-1/2/3 large subunit
VDVVASMTPLTKMARQIVSTTTIPSIVREAFRVAQQERPGPVHLELPEDIAREEALHLLPVPTHPIEIPVANPAALDRAAAMALDAERPLIMLGAAASRPRLAESLSDFRAPRVKYAESYGAKGSRVETADGLAAKLEAAFEMGGIHLVAVPVDYSENKRVLVDELRNLNV